MVETIDRVVHCSFGESAAEHRKHSPPGKNQVASTPPDSSYRVFDYPLESPIFGNRTLVTKPYNKFTPLGTGIGPSNGWHEDSTGTANFLAGNNVWAYQDVNSNNGPVSYDPVSVGLSFDYSYSPDSSSASNQNAAVTNLFYWNNLVHDVLWRYGFDEPSGNFQTSNMSRGGQGMDFVRAEAQDGGGMNNANFYTPVDGQLPRMQMYLFSNGTDGDFDNGIIAHEYGHGWSNRLTGGPAMVGCLNNVEQGGEGWSDYLTLMLTTDWSSLEPTVADAGIGRGIGNYVLGNPITGKGIRPYRYSYNKDSLNNPVTYAKVGDTNNFSRPHGIGSIWATTLWDMTWEIIFQDDSIVHDIHNVPASTTDLIGNLAALKLVNEGLRLQPCSPSFIDARDAILKADEMLFGGRYRCAIGKAFARRGMGALASSGFSTDDRFVTEDFTLLSGTPLDAITVTPEICSGELFDLTTSTSASGTFSFSWERVAQNGITGSGNSGTGANIQETITNSTIYPAVVQYNVTVSPDACNASPKPQPVYVKVKPKVIPEVSLYDVCQGTAVPVSEGLVAPNAYTTTINGTLTSTTPTYRRGQGSDINYYLASDVGTNVHYVTYAFKAAESAPISIETVAGTLSGTYPELNYLTLYKNNFDPQNPANNFLKGDDVTGRNWPRPKIRYTLQKDTVYVLVAATYFNNITGNFTLESNMPIFGGFNNWYTDASGGSSLSTNNIFNPVGLAGSGITNTETALSKTFYVATNLYPECRTPVTFHINANDAPTGTVSDNAQVCPGDNSGTLTLSGHQGMVVNWQSSIDGFTTSDSLPNITASQSYTNLNADTRFRAVVKNGACPPGYSASASIVVKKATFTASSPDYDLNGQSGSLEALEYINASNKVSNSSTAQLTAGKAIELKEGFEVSNSVFEALIEDVCPN